MNILILMTGSYPPSEGIGSYVFNLANRLAKDKKNRITILTRNRKEFKRKETILNNIRIISIPIIKVPFFGLFHFRKKISDEFRNDEFDIIHYNSPLMFFVNSLKTKKNILTIHSTMKSSVKFLEPFGFVTFLKMIMGFFLSPIVERSLLKNCDNIITVSELTSIELKDLYNFKLNDKITLIPNCIDEKIFYPKGMNKKNQFCTIGRLDYGKGILEILHAINNVKLVFRKYNFKFIFIGDGPLLEKFNKKIHQLDISDLICHIKHLSQNQISLNLNQSYFSVINSKYETGPRTAIESMSVGTPIISTDVGFLKNVRDKNLFIKIGEDSFTLEEAFVYAIKIINSEEYTNFKRKSLFFSQKYLCCNLKNTIEDIYE